MLLGGRGGGATQLYNKKAWSSVLNSVPWNIVFSVVRTSDEYLI
jgi:hypothetical protein